MQYCLPRLFSTMWVAIVITTLALATGAHSQQSLRQDPEVNYSPVSDCVMRHDARDTEQPFN